MTVTIALIVMPSGVGAFSLLGGGWADPDPVLYWVYATGQVDRTAYLDAKSDWNATPTPVGFSGAGHEDNEQVGFTTVSIATVGWDGLAAWSPCPSGDCTYTYVTLKLNRFYTDGYGAGKRKSVASHEMGHAWGLAHVATDARLMNPFTCGNNSRWCTFQVNEPGQDEINGVNTIY